MPSFIFIGTTFGVGHNKTCDLGHNDSSSPPLCLIVMDFIIIDTFKFLKTKVILFCNSTEGGYNVAEIIFVLRVLKMEVNHNMINSVLYTIKVIYLLCV